MNILAFDLGASGGKLFLAKIDGDNVSIENIHRFDNVSYSANGALFWDIINIYKEMNVGIKKAIEMTDDQIDSFAIDSFSNDFGLIDKNGQLLTQVRCYRDERTARHADKIYSKLSKEKLYELSGNQNALFNTYLQLGAMREDGHGFLLDNAYKLLFIPDLLINFLTGKTISEYTISSVSQLYDFKKDDWCQEILDSYDIPRELFGTLTKPGTLLGNTQESYNEMMGTKGFPVSVVCEHDTASAYLSSPLHTDCALVSCGTWSLIGTELDHCVITPEGYAANLANEGGYEGHHRILRNVMGSCSYRRANVITKNMEKTTVSVNSVNSPKLQNHSVFYLIRMNLFFIIRVICQRKSRSTVWNTTERLRKQSARLSAVSTKALP